MYCFHEVYGDKFEFEFSWIKYSVFFIGIFTRTLKTTTELAEGDSGYQSHLWPPHLLTDTNLQQCEKLFKQALLHKIKCVNDFYINDGISAKIFLQNVWLPYLQIITSDLSEKKTHTFCFQGHYQGTTLPIR